LDPHHHRPLPRTIDATAEIAAPAGLLMHETDADAWSTAAEPNEVCGNELHWKKRSESVIEGICHPKQAVSS
jgi:hypothetical protein